MSIDLRDIKVKTGLGVKCIFLFSVYTNKKKEAKEENMKKIKTISLVYKIFFSE